MVAPNIHCKVGGSWKSVNKVHVNVGGTWKQVTKVHVNVGGFWKLAHQYNENWQRDTIAFTDTSSPYYIGCTVIDNSYATGIMLPSGQWSRQTVNGQPNLGTVLVRHVPPAWVPVDNNIHSAACDISMLNYSFSGSGLHIGLLSRHPGTNYNTAGNRCSAAVAGEYNGRDYSFVLENIEFANPPSTVRDPWQAYGSMPTSNEVVRRMEIHTRWKGGVSSSRAILRVSMGGAVLQDSGWCDIGGAYPTTFSDLSRNWTGLFYVDSTPPFRFEACSFSNVRSSWSSGDAPLLTDL